MPACPGSDPILLSCAKKNGVGRQEEVAQRKPLKGFSLDSFGNKRAAALLRSREFQICIAFPMGQSSTYFGSTLFLACKYPLVCKKSDDFRAEQQIWRHLSAARHFCSAKILAGRAAMGDGALIAEGKVPRAKKFPEEICFAPSRVCQVCRTPDYRAFKSTQHAQPVQPSVPGSPGGRGAAPLCFRRSPEETIPKGFLWAISSRRLDTALLCAAKKRGVESPGWQASASGTLAPAPRQEVKRQPRQARPNLNLSLKPSQGFYKLRSRSAAATNEARAGFDKPLHMLRKLA